MFCLMWGFWVIFLSKAQDGFLLMSSRETRQDLAVCCALRTHQGLLNGLYSFGFTIDRPFLKNVSRSKNLIGYCIHFITSLLITPSILITYAV